ncbi:MAG: hypothetical protein CMP47_13935 [Rickettsiales bacterium]|nr:hypothetical protein [Rickettsiales bacterium]
MTTTAADPTEPHVILLDGDTAFNSVRDATVQGDGIYPLADDEHASFQSGLQGDVVGEVTHPDTDSFGPRWSRSSDATIPFDLCLEWQICLLFRAKTKK